MPPAIYQPGAGAAFTLSAFGDEIDADLDTQLRVMGELRIGFLELHAAWGTNVSDLDDRQHGQDAEDLPVNGGPMNLVSMLLGCSCRRGSLAHDFLLSSRR